MLFLKYLIIGIQFLLASVPVGLSVYAAAAGSLRFAVLSVLAVFGAVAVLPLCRRRESLWVFVLSFLTVTPLNITLILDMLANPILEGHFLLTGIVRGILLFTVAVSTEELIFLLIARRIWKRQYRLTMTKDIEQ